ncbi:MAG: tetratricopeptide repeat protein [Verrucomicrobiales bacterium]
MMKLNSVIVTSLSLFVIVSATVGDDEDSAIDKKSNDQIGAAEELRAQGEKDAALKIYEELTLTGSSPEIVAESAVKAALLFSEKGDSKMAVQFFQKVFDSSSAPPEWKALAQYGLIQQFFQSKNYADVIRTFKKPVSVALPSNTRSTMLIMVGDSYRFEGDSDAARRMYNRVRDKYGENADIGTLVQKKLDQMNTEDNGDREQD